MKIEQAFYNERTRNSDMITKSYCRRQATKNIKQVEGSYRFPKLKELKQMFVEKELYGIESDKVYWVSASDTVSRVYLNEQGDVFKKRHPTNTRSSLAYVLPVKWGANVRVIKTEKTRANEVPLHVPVLGIPKESISSTVKELPFNEQVVAKSSEDSVVGVSKKPFNLNEPQYELLKIKSKLKKNTALIDSLLTDSRFQKRLIDILHLYNANTLKGKENLTKNDGDRVSFICECNSLEHQLVFWYDKEDNDLYCESHLSTHTGFFKRLYSGLRYAFGYKSKFGNWDSTIFKQADLKKLMEFLNANIKQN